MDSTENFNSSIKGDTLSFLRSKSSPKLLQLKKTIPSSSTIYSTWPTVGDKWHCGKVTCCCLTMELPPGMELETHALNVYAIIESDNIH